MRIVEGVPVLPIPAQPKRCPTQTIVIVSIVDWELERASRGVYPDDVARWVFGPGTRHPWPEGDYYVGPAYLERAFQTYHEFYRGEAHGDYVVIDPDVIMDEGL